MDITTKEKLKAYFTGDKFAELTGVNIVEIGIGSCKTMLQIDKHHLNAAGVIQGGAIFTLADVAFAVAANSHGQLALAINATISYLQGRSKGDILYAEARELSPPKKLATYEVVVTDEDEEIIAKFTGTVYRKKEMLQLY